MKAFLAKLSLGAKLGLVCIGGLLFVSLFAPWLAPHHPFELHSGALRLPPFWSEGGSLTYPLGTDDLGRDQLSRLLFGARVSLSVGLSVVLISLFLGGLIGLLAGFFRGLIDQFFMRSIDLLMSMPSILLALVVVAILGPGLINAVLAVSLVAVPNFARLVRASVLEEMQKDYVLAARSLGLSRFRLLFFHVLPNCMGPIIVQASLGVSDGILNVAALGFLGLGAEPPTPEWGMMLSDGRAYIQSAPWLVTLPGLFILITVLSFNLFGDGLRDALDPKTRKI
jgi:dipeptide transport system permease protein